jgi:hypothetical protein
VLLSARDAGAYPQFQLSTGADTCRQCHVSPGGGGLIDDYGRDEAGSTLSDRGGDGRFLHGLWTPPDALAIGGDVRLAAGARDSAVATETFAFPMQAELYLRPRVGPVSLYLAVGLRGAARRPRSAVERLASREHYAIYERDAWYLRAGRFFPVFGVRTQDHTAYVRRHAQMGLLEEPYGAGFGRYGASWELHLSAFTGAPVPLLGVARDTGVAAYLERRNGQATAAHAVQARVTTSATDRRGLIGAVYRRWLEESKLVVLAELDLGVQAFPGAMEAPALWQVIGHAGVTYLARPGVMVGGTVQAYDPDLALETTSRAAAQLDAQWFPFAHLELHLTGKVEAAGLDLDHPDLLALLQLHYFL